MATSNLRLTLSVWLLVGSLLLAEATYYRHHRYVPHIPRHREHSANAENLLPEVSNPSHGSSQPGAPTYPVTPEPVHPAPEAVHPAEAYPVAPEVAYSPRTLHQHDGRSPINTSRIFYGIMFDAGSTGSRIHIYKFIQKDPVELPVLDNEIYHAVKPGLSSYKDKPEEGGNTIRQLLKIAKKAIPKEAWSRTPVVLKATAGLRMLPEEKANALLKEVQEVLDDSPFFVREDGVSIMNGANEGMLGISSKTVGILDLGGGSTQITFLPKSKKTIETAPETYISSFDLFNHTYQVYTHSYLGNGLYAARLAILGAKDTDGSVSATVTQLPSVPFLPDTRYAGYKLCYYEVMKVIKGIVHQPYEVKGNSIFYAFSYYFDRAVETGLIGEWAHAKSLSGTIISCDNYHLMHKVVCNKMTKYRAISPFLCMDMTYITCLLKEGFGKCPSPPCFTRPHRGIFNTFGEEHFWALGATFDYYRNLNIH
uniref:nucleoside diphosphate phosphatase n=1 Tax=Takifugu rubripes TaxID=31033 RepID=A0A674MZ10_TAKRU